MRRIMMIGSCLVAIAATAGLAAASASAALPEYLECAKIKTHKGEFTTSNCSTKSETKTGNFELLPVTKAHKVNAAGTGATLESSVGKVECKTAAAKGSIVNAKEWAATTVRYTDCFLEGKKCLSAGQTKSVIVTAALAGPIGYLAGKGTGTPKVGLALTAEKGEAAEFSCEGVEVRVKGTVIGELGGDINTVSTNVTLKYVQTKTVQEWTSFEGGKVGEDTLKTEAKKTKEGKFEPEGGAVSGYSVSQAGKTSGFVEIKA
jgi:hypothetical protein